MNVSNGTGKPSPHPIVLMTSSLLKTDEQNQKNIHIYRVPCDVQYMKEKKKKKTRTSLLICQQPWQESQED
jgi:hypothetical protein